MAERILKYIHTSPPVEDYRIWSTKRAEVLQSPKKKKYGCENRSSLQKHIMARTIVQHVPVSKEAR